MPLKKSILRKIPAILIMAAILALSTLPGNDPLLKTFEFSDKIKHVVAYFVLGISFCLWIPSKKWLAKPFLWGITVVVLCTVFGILDEYHQSFRPGRSGNDLGDIIANFIGGLIAAITYCIAVHIIKRRVKVSGST